jgi:hypothetical protein
MAHTPQHEMAEEEIRARVEDELGVAGNNSQELANSSLGTLGSRMMIADQLYPKQEIDPAMAAFLYFNNMARAASQPGATVVGSAAQAFEDPAKYLMQTKKSNQAMEQAKAKAILGTGSSTGTPGSNVQSKVTYGNGTIQLVLRDGTVVFKEKGSNTIVPQDQVERVLEEGLKYGIVEEGLKTFEVEKKKQSIKKAEDLFGQVDKIDANVRNLVKAQGIVQKAMDEGKNLSGFITQFAPDVSAAAISLKEVQTRLGLDVIGAVTFGALSKGELDLALNSAIRLDLPEAELAQNLQDRINAQNKLRGYLLAQARFLNKGNSIDQWYDVLDERRAIQQTNTSFTAEVISTMTIEDINEVDADTLNLPALKAYNKRMSELING